MSTEVGAMIKEGVVPTKDSPAKKEKKKTHKKKTVKKAPVKKASKEQQRKGVKRNAGQDQVFVLLNGHKVKNVKELADVIERIEDYVFNHHVNQDKHDFAVWLKEVFGEIALAEELAQAKDKGHVQLVLYKHISHKLW